VKESIAGLKPEKMWDYFYQMSQIPRESKHEEQVLEWVKKVARELNLPFKQDDAGNIVIAKPASPGYENAPGVVLQGHVDMVCEKNKGTEHDFRKDPIRLVRDGDYITADGTTLGADNGIGVAAALAVLADDELLHPPVEALFTVDEETGLTGANALQPGFVEGRILVNCDSEEDGALYVGCAGGKDTEMFFDIPWEKATSGKKALIAKITGLKGGHSGLDIHVQRANAVKQLNRVLWKAAEKFDIRLYYIDGGSKHNAIPREADAKLLIDTGDFDAFQQMIKEYESVLQNEFKSVEPGLQLLVEETAEYPEQVFTAEFQSRLMNFLYVIPHGVQAMSNDIEGLVETSTNMATIHTDEKQIAVLTSQRSSVASEIVDIADKVKASGLLAGADVRQGLGYPAWQPNMDSKILKFMKETYKQRYGEYPQVKAIHAGLECGIIGEKYDGMDMISFGPTILGAHSPDERVEIRTVEKFWELLVEVLAQLAKE